MTDKNRLIGSIFNYHGTLLKTIKIESDQLIDCKSCYFHSINPKIQCRNDFDKNTRIDLTTHRDTLITGSCRYCNRKDNTNIYFKEIKR